MSQQEKMAFARQLQMEFQTGVNADRRGRSRGRANGNVRGRLSTGPQAYGSPHSIPNARSLPNSTVYTRPALANANSNNHSQAPRAEVNTTLVDWLAGTKESGSTITSTKPTPSADVQTPVISGVPAVIQPAESNQRNGPLKGEATHPPSSRVDSAGSQPAEGTNNYVGLATSLLARVENAEAETKEAAPTPIEEPEFGTALWAFKQLEAGIPLPDKDEFRARKGEKDGLGIELVTSVPKQSESVEKITPTTQDAKQGTGLGRIHELREMLTSKRCNCPRRARPVNGLSASRFNTNDDGDIEVYDMPSTTARNRFAVNVILHDHPIPNCPVLQETMAQFPLAFGASPAAVDEPEDVLNVIPWSSRNVALARPSAHRPSARRGLNASVWAD